MFSMLSNFKHGQEMRASKDEILVGEIVRDMMNLGNPAIGFKAGEGQQAIRFKPNRDSVLYAITVTLDRKTGGSRLQEAVIGSKAVLRVQAEVKNYLADPDDLIHMYKTDLQNLFKMPMLGDIRLNHQLNSVLGTKKLVIDIDQHLSINGDENKRRLQDLLSSTIAELREKLTPYKKG